MTRFPALTALLLASTAAFAQAGDPGAPFLAIWDRDGDGSVTPEEAQTRRGEIFAAFDADENGQLSAEERAAMDEMREAERQAMRDAGAGTGMGKGAGKGPMGMAWNEAGPMPGGLDADGDGQVSQAEFLDATADWFARMDRDGDGVITAADFGRT